MSSTQSAKHFFLVLLALTSVLLGLVLQPFASALVLAGVGAAVLWPLMERLARRVGGRRGLAAGLVLAVTLVTVVGPLVALSTYAVREASAGVKLVRDTVRSEGVQGLVEKLPGPLQKLATELIGRLPREAGDGDAEALGDQLNAQGGKAAVAVGSMMSTVGVLLLEAMLTAIALFFLLVRGAEVVAWLDRVSPLRPGQTHELFREFKRVSHSVLVSTVVTAAAQAAVALVGYLIASVPNAVFFTAVTFVLAFVPAVGAGSVCCAAAALLLVTGHPNMGIFLGLWGVFVVGLIDNVIKPLLMRGGTELHEAVVLFSILGGLAAFGAIGVLVGPLVIAFFLALVRIYTRDFTSKHADVPTPAA